MAGAFTDQVVVITGASSGLGRALALEFARAGATVVLAARSEEKLRAVAEEVRAGGRRAEVVPTDLTQADEVDRLVARARELCGRLDVLVNNAGYGVTSFLEEVPMEELARLFQVNVYAPVRLVQRALPHFAPGRGLIVNIGSVIGRRALPTVGSYCMTKFALAAFSEALRAEVAHRGVHVLEVEPGLTATGFSDHRVVIGPHPRTYRTRFVMAADTAARRIVAAAARRRDRLVLGLPGKLLLLANGIAPWLVNRLLAAAVARQHGAPPPT